MCSFIENIICLVDLRSLSIRRKCIVCVKMGDILLFKAVAECHMYFSFEISAGG